MSEEYKTPQKSYDVARLNRLLDRAFYGSAPQEKSRVKRLEADLGQPIPGSWTKNEAKMPKSVDEAAANAAQYLEHKGVERHDDFGSSDDPDGCL